MRKIDKRIRRMAGFLTRAWGDLSLSQITRGLKRSDRRWKTTTLLQATLVGLMAGEKSLRDIETLTQLLSRPARKLVGVGRRLPDTTLRDNLLRVPVNALRDAMRRQILAWSKRKCLPRSHGLPFGIVSMDGKSSTIDDLGHEFVQRKVHEKSHRAYGLLRTITCALISTDTAPCIDMIPMPGNTNEVGFFATCFKALLARYRQLFQVVMYDAGADSKKNAETVVKAGKDYIFRVKDERRIRIQTMKSLLENAEPCAQTEDVIDSRTVCRRTLFMKACTHEPHWKYKHVQLLWPTTKTILRVRSETWVEEKCVQSHDFLYDTSLHHAQLTPEQWLWVLRRRWAVENDVHGALDVGFEEDDRVGIRTQAEGALALMVLRRIAYNMLAMQRKGFFKDDEADLLAYKTLFKWMDKLLLGLEHFHIRGLRQRAEAVSITC